MESNSLILSQEEFLSLPSLSQITIEPNVAIVLYGKSGELTSLMPGQRLKSSETAWKKYKGFYRVDMGIHVFEFHTKAPCGKDAFYYDVTVNVMYRVDNPIEIVKNQVRDVQTLLKPEIIKRIRAASRKFSVEQSKEAEQEINNSFDKGIYTNGIIASQIVASVELESESLEHLRFVQNIKNEITRQEFFHELEIVKSKHEIELKKLKLDFYAPLIKKGEWELLALQLAEHPDDVATIANMVAQLRQAELDVQLDLLKSMITDGVIEAMQIEEAGKQELLQLVDSLNSVSNKNADITETLSSTRAERPSLNSVSNKNADITVNGDLITGDENKINPPSENHVKEIEHQTDQQDTVTDSVSGKDNVIIVSEPPTPPSDNLDLQSNVNEKNYKVSISFPLLLSKRFDSVFLFQLYLPEHRSRVDRNIKAQFHKKPREVIDQSMVRIGQKIQVDFYSTNLDFSKPVIKLVDRTLTKIVFFGSPKDTCQPGTHYVLVGISDVATQQEIESFNLEVRVVDFAFDHISRPLLSRVSAIILGIGSFAMFLLTLLEQIDKTIGLTSGTAAGVLAAVIYANFYNLYQRIRPSSP